MIQCNRVPTGFCLLLAVLLLSPTSSFAATAIVPTDYPTVQQAVNAVQGTGDAKVIINSNAVLNETVTITQSVTIEAGTGYTPTIQGMDSHTIYFNPNSASIRSLTLKGLTLLPRTGLGSGGGYYIIDIQNGGTGSTDILIDGVTIDDPEEAGPYGISIRAAGWGVGGSNVVNVKNTTITLGGAPSYGVTAIFMGEKGTLLVSGTTINMSLGSSDCFDIRGSQGGGITFTLEDSTFNISAPLGSYSAEVGRLSDWVTAAIQGNTFNLTSNTQGYANGIITGWGSQSVTLNSNRFNGFGPQTGSAYSAFPFSDDAGTLVATNNVISNMGIGFMLTPQQGTPGGIVNATLTNNTIDGSERSAIEFSAQDGSTINATATNNLFTNSGRYGFESYLGSSSTLNVANGYNNFFNNELGATDGQVILGPNNLQANPLYVNRAGGNFRLRSASPVVNMGKDSAPSLPATDADGNPRIYGSAVDMGAYEYMPYTHITIDPEDGAFGTEMIISGPGFGTKKGKVLIGTTALKVLGWEDDWIQCRLTRVLSPDVYDVTIQPKGASSSVVDNGFTVKAPKIESVDPTSGSAGDEITINGSFFGTKKGKLTFGEKKCRVLGWTMDPITGEGEIRFVVPKGLSFGISGLQVINGVGADTVNFTVD